MSIPALIFDLDDTLVATAKAWTIAEESILKAFDTNYDQAFLAHLSGHSARDVARIIHKQAEPPVTLEHVQDCFDRALLNAMEVAPLKPRPGAIDLVRTKSRDWKRVVASGSPPSVIDFVLKRLGIADCFEHTVSSYEVGEGKPSPKVFLEAARRVEVPPERCLVIEDSLVGVQAAKAAGMACFVVPSRAETANQIRFLADQVFESLADITEDAMTAALKLGKRTVYSR
jgi:HAD superfamily hydrolase (TIGR01509 family)